MKRIVRAACFALVIFGILFLTTSTRAQAMTDEAYAALLQRAQTEGRNILSVNPYTQYGSGYYQRITDAVNAASDGDIILIYPGIYLESLDLRGKELILVGWDRNECVIRYDTKDYFHPVLNASAGEFVRLTLYGVKGDEPSRLKSEEAGQEANAEEAATTSGIAVDPDLYPAYTVHIEDDHQYGRNVLFDNCQIVSENNFCVGIGIRGNSNVTFANCLLRSVGMGGCVFVHDSVDPEYGGDQTSLVFRNNRWENYGAPYLMSLYSYIPTNRIRTTFQDVKVFTYAVDKRSSYHEGNYYTGADIEQTIGHRIADPVNKIYAVSEEESYGYLGQLKKALLDQYEGVTYLQVKDRQIMAGDYVPKPSDQFLKICLFDIYNASGLPGSGWCGSDDFFLTEDSYGNTLGEMNYGF